jgi:hypothetical protein
VGSYPIRVGDVADCADTGTATTTANTKLAAHTMGPLALDFIIPTSSLQLVLKQRLLTS